MLFNSYEFVLVFLPLCVIGYFLLNRIGTIYANILLLGMSLFFYGYLNPRYVLIIISSILVNYLFTRGISGRIEAGKRKALLVCDVAFNLLLLGYFKYMDFFIRNINGIFGQNIGLLRIALPLGISFFTFQQISYVVDVYHGRIECKKLLDYACFVCFFPQLVAGPIVSGEEFFPQFTNPANRKMNYNNLGMGIYLFSLGLAKKVLIADVLGEAVNQAYYSLDNIKELNSLTAVFIVFAYAFQLYFDFSGYSDMAIGIGKMFNIELPVNFNSPYKAHSITDFWKRWHLTLTRFLTKNLYIPLGGNRKGTARTYLNTMIVFLLSGLWHGADWTFVFWGFCHGVFSVFERAAKKIVDRIPRWIGRIVTFVMVSVLWVFFRADDFQQAFALLQQVFIGGGGMIPEIYVNIFKIPEFAFVFNGRDIMTRIPLIIMIGYIVVTCGIAFFAKNNEEGYQTRQFDVKKAVVSAILLVWCIFSFENISTFLYFNF